MSKIVTLLEKFQGDGLWIELKLYPPVGCTMIQPLGNRMFVNEGRLGEFEDIDEVFFDALIDRFDSRFKTK